MSPAPGLALLTALFPTPAMAADALPQSSTFGAFLQGLFGLLLVLGLLYGFFWLLRRYGPAQSGAQGLVKVVGGVMLGPRERLVIVEVRDTWLLIGVAAGHVSTLHTLPKPEGVEAPAAAMPQSPFADRLAALLRRPKG